MSPRELPVARLLLHPAGATLAVAVAFAADACFAATARIVDPDVWWVAAAGRVMLAAGRAPTTNMFSYAEPQHPWIMHEWLFGVPYALGLEHVGPGFFALAALVALTIASALVIRATLGRCRHPVAGMALALIALGPFVGRLVIARPTGVSLIFPMAMAAIAFAPRLSPARAAAAIALELVWANAHGSFPLGVVLLVTSALDDWPHRGRRLATAAAAALVTLINPYGSSLHGLVLGYLTGKNDVYATIHEQIVEFAPLWRDHGRVVDSFQRCGLLLMVGLLVSAARDKALRARVALCVVLLGLAVRQVRHVELFAILTAMLLAPHADALAERWLGPDKASGPRRRPVELALLPGLLAALVGYAVTARGRDFDRWLDPHVATSGFVALTRALPDNARVYTSFAESGLLLWLGADRGVRTLRDPRNDCYSREIMEVDAALQLPISSSDEAEARLQRADADYLLLRSSHPVRPWVENNPEWSEIRRVDGYALFRRSQPAIDQRTRPSG